MKKFLGMIIAILVLAIAAIFAYSHFILDKQPDTVIVEKPSGGEQNIVEGVAEEIAEAVELERVTEQTGEIIEDGFKDIGRLETYEYYYTQVQNNESVQQINGFSIPLTKSTYVFSYDGTITAGIDFKDIKVTADEDSSTITIEIPEAEVFHNEIDPDTLEIYVDSSSIFNQLKVEDVNNMISAMEKKALSSALEKGLLDNAQRNAETMIKNLVDGVVGEQDIKVVYK